MQQLVIKTFTMGLRQDVQPDALPEGAVLLTDNMSLFQGDIGLVAGYSQFVPGMTPLTGAYILHIDELPLEAGIIYLLVATDTHIYKYNGVGFDDLSGAVYTADIDHPWLVGIVANPAGDMFTIWADDSRDPVQKWDGVAATFVNLTGSPFDAGKHFSRVATDYQNHLMHLNRTEGGTHKPRMLRWSDNGVPETYTGGEAGFLVLFQGPDWGMTLEPLSVYMAAYRERSIHLISYVGSPFFMAQRQVIDGVGLIGPRALLNLDNQHIFVGNDNVYVFNGADLTPIGDPIRDDMFGRLDARYLLRVQVLYDELRNDVIIAIPTQTSQPLGTPDTWYYYNLPTQAWSGPRQGRPVYGSGNWQRTTGSRWVDMPAGLSWLMMTGTWQQARLLQAIPSILFGNTTRIVYFINQAVVTEDGATITGRLETGAYHPGKMVFNPFVDETTCNRIRPIGDGTLGDISWFIGRSNDTDGSYIWEGPYFEGVRGFVNTKPVTSRWFKFAIQATGINRVAGFVADFEAAG